VKRHTLLIFAVSSLALAAPVAYFVVKDGAPDTFERQVDEAYNAWKNVPATTLSIQKRQDAETRFVWGDKDIEFNPDVGTRTLVTTDGTKTTLEVRVNPEQPVDLPSALLVEAGLRLGLELDASIAGKRSIGEAEIRLLRTRYSPNGDVNADGKVNVDDLELFALQYGKRSERVGGDFNGDGVVNDADLEILRKNYDFGGDIEIPKPPAPPAPGVPTTPGSPTTPPNPATPPATPPAPPASPTPPTAPPTPPTPPPASPPPAGP
jgi:hypothetical protein